MTKYSTVNLKLLLYIIMGYSFITPFYLAQHNFLSSINKLLMALSILFVVLFYLSDISSKFISKSIFFLIAYYLSLLISNANNQTLEFRDFIPVVMGLSFALLINSSLNNKKDLLNLLLALNILGYTYAIINLLLIYIYPEGIPSLLQTEGRRYYLFGNINTTSRYLIPGLLFAFLYDLLKFKRVRKRSWLLLVIAWITLIKLWAVTGMLGLFVFTVIILIKMNKNKLFLLYICSIIISLSLTIFLVFFKSDSIILSTILDFFNKDMTFSHRDRLWLNAVSMINQSPVWGFGNFSQQEMELYIGNKFSSHNYYLDILLRGGFIALTILICGLLYIGKSIFTSQGTIVITLLTAISSSYFIMWIAEPFISTESFMLPILLIILSRTQSLEKYYFDIDIM